MFSITCSFSRRSFFFLSFLSSTLSIELEITSAGFNSKINTHNTKAITRNAITAPVVPIALERITAKKVPKTPPPISLHPKSYALDNETSMPPFMLIFPFEI